MVEGVADQHTWRWTVDGRYTAKLAYKMLLEGTHDRHHTNLIWRTWAPLKVKLFLWLAFRRRIWTADRRQRHGLDANQVASFAARNQRHVTTSWLHAFSPDRFGAQPCSPRRPATPTRPPHTTGLVDAAETAPPGNQTARIRQSFHLYQLAHLEGDGRQALPQRGGTTAAAPHEHQV